MSAFDEAVERIALDRILGLEDELRRERAESSRCRAVAEAASEFVDNYRNSNNVHAMMRGDLDSLYVRVEQWRLDNERLLRDDRESP